MALAHIVRPVPIALQSTMAPVNLRHNRAAESIPHRHYGKSGINRKKTGQNNILHRFAHDKSNPHLRRIEYGIFQRFGGNRFDFPADSVATAAVQPHKRKIFLRLVRRSVIGTGGIPE